MIRWGAIRIGSDVSGKMRLNSTMTRSKLVSSPTQAIRGIAGCACDTQWPTIGPASSWRLAIGSTLSRRARTSPGQGGGSCVPVHV